MKKGSGFGKFSLFLLLIPSLLVTGCSRFGIPKNAGKTDVLIVGGGISGLVTAHLLKKEGLTYKILELRPRVGGRIQTARYPGNISVEAGLEEFWEGNRAIELLHEFKIPLTSVAPHSSVVVGGKLYPYIQESVDEYLETLFQKGEIEKLKNWEKKTLKIVDKIRGRQLEALWHLKEISFGEWVRRSGLPQKVQEWIRVTLEVEIATGWDSLSALDGIDEWEKFIGKGQTGYEVEGGNQRLVDALVQSIGSRNILVNTQVKSIRSTTDGVHITVMETSTLVHKDYEADFVVVTAPLFRLPFEVQFDPQLSSKVQEAIAAQNWGAYFTAHLFLDPAAEKYWMIDGVNTLAILSDGPLGVIYDGNAEEKNPPYRVLNFLCTGAYAEGFNLQPLPAVRQELETALEKFWPGISQYVKKWEFFRYHPRAIAGWPVGRSRFDELSEEVRKPQGRLYFAGDFTENTHSDGAVQSAYRVVQGIVQHKKEP
ncbi:MAG: FAD-dependent oxidoreductase [Deltaproteobacteria bacterium]|nr:FAD-dependent oxidoreductase [Deltaproteobacteria bacterium]